MKKEFHKKVAMSDMLCILNSKIFPIYFTFNMDNQSSRTVVPLPGPPSLLEPTDDRLLTDS